MPTNTGVQTPHPAAGVMGVLDELTFHCRLVTTTSGTLDTTLNTGTWAPAGITVTKTATKTGRYTFNMPSSFQRLLNVIATPVGPDDATYGASTTGGPAYFVRDDDVTATVFRAGSNQDGSFELQFVRTDTNADAELPDGTAVMVTIIVARGKTF